MRQLNVLIRLAVCLLFVFLPLHNMDEWFYDQFFGLRTRVRDTTDIVLVSINDAKLQPLYAKENKNFPREEFSFRPKAHSIWYPNLYETLIGRIEADHPKLIVFTSFYEWVAQGGQKKGLPDPVILSAYLNEENKLVPPPPRLMTDQNYGFNNLFPDSDNIVRRTHLVYSFGSSLAVRAYRKLFQAPIQRDLISPLWIDFRGPTGSYPTYDGWSLLGDAAPKGTFTGKVVFVGRTGIPNWDFETPVGRMPRLEIQANILDTFLHQREIHMLPRWAMLTVSCIAVGVSVAIILSFSLTAAWVLLLGFSMLFLATAFFSLVELKLWIGVANPIFCIFGSHLLMLGFKLSRQEEEQWKVQQESEYLKEMDQFKNNFISLFSHDLKTPIAKIKAVTDRLLSEHPELSLPVRDSLRVVERTNGELARLISDILKVTKMESLSVEPKKEVVDLNRLVEAAIQRLKFLADEKQISIVLDLEPLFSIEGDQQLILEVIINLVENAIKYSRFGRKVVVRTMEKENRVWVSVKDEGEGIPADELPRVTGKFYRGTTSENTKGSGLGLYLSKYFVELHQGGLEILSELKRGTEVRFWLPLVS